jgi:hypothetical protein
MKPFHSIFARIRFGLRLVSQKKPNMFVQSCVSRRLSFSRFALSSLEMAATTKREQQQRPRESDWLAGGSRLSAAGYSRYFKALEYEYRVKTIVLGTIKRYSIFSLILYLEEYSVYSICGRWRAPLAKQRKKML